VDDIDLAGTRNSNDLYVRRIIQSHRTCQVRSGVSSEIAAKRNNNRFKIFAHNFLPFKKMPKLPEVPKMPKINVSGYLERTSCIGCGSGFQPRSFNFAAGSRSHRGFFMVTWTFRISALMYSFYYMKSSKAN
jgi:hypothetical protein